MSIEKFTSSWLLNHYPQGRLVFDNSYDLVECVAKLAALVNQVVDETNVLLSTDLEQFVRAKMVEWENDGTISGMVNSGTVKTSGDFIISGDVTFSKGVFVPSKTSTDNTTAAASTAFVQSVVDPVKVEIDGILDIVLDKSVNVRRFGAVGDGVTNDATAIQSAINACVAIGGGTVFFPNGKYRVSSTVYVPALVSLVGNHAASVVGGSNCVIIGDAPLSVVVDINGGGGNGMAHIRNIDISRNSVSFLTSTVGINISSANYVSLENVAVNRQGVGIKDNASLGLMCNNVIVYGCNLDYIQLNGSIQSTFIGCSFGRNGAEEGITGATCLVRITGAADTISFVRCQFNPTTAAVIPHAVFFTNINDVNGIYVFDACHAENCERFISSDSMAMNLKRITVSNCSIHTVKAVEVGALTTISESRFVNNNVSGSFNAIVGGGGDNFFSDNLFMSAFAINCPNLFFHGNKVNGAVTLHEMVTGQCYGNRIVGAFNYGTGIAPRDNL